MSFLLDKFEIIQLIEEAQDQEELDTYLDALSSNLTDVEILVDVVLKHKETLLEVIETHRKKINAE